MIIHVVESGQTLQKIASQYGVSMQRLTTDNGIAPPYRLTVGQAILVLFPKQLHSVKSGETLQSIADKYGTTTVDILQNNPSLGGNFYINTGDELVIYYREQPLGNLEVNGYAYTYIDRKILLKTLPYLSRLTIFGYGFTEDGRLIDIDDKELIDLAKEYYAKPIMIISSITESGTFSNQRVNNILKNPDLQNKVIDAILDKMKQKGYEGLEFDFEFIEAENTNAYIEFIRKTTQRLNAEGFVTNVDLAPKVSATQAGLVYEAHDYPRIGEIANTVFLMTYEWGYTAGPPMAVAPINKVRQVVEYALTVIPENKIFMGIPNYGYNWIIPYKKGAHLAPTIGNIEAVDLAVRTNSQIRYDDEAQSPFFFYIDQGTQHEVWFEDARSIQAKLDLADEKKLLGVGYWNIMKWFPQSWMLTNVLFNIKKYFPAS